MDCTGKLHWMFRMINLTFLVVSLGVVMLKKKPSGITQAVMVL